MNGEKDILTVICQMGYVDLTRLSQREADRYYKEFAKGTFNIKAQQTCFLHITDQRWMAVTMKETTTTSIGIIPGVGIPVRKKEKGSNVYLSIWYDNVRRYNIQRSNVKKGDEASFCIETPTFFAAIIPTDSRSMDGWKNSDLLANIEKMYLEMGLEPRRSWGSAYFNIPLANFFKQLLDKILSDDQPRRQGPARREEPARQRREPARRQEPARQRREPAKREEPARRRRPEPIVTDEGEVVPCPECGEDNWADSRYCHYCDADLS